MSSSGVDEFRLGDRVVFDGTWKKVRRVADWSSIEYVRSKLPGFVGYGRGEGGRWGETWSKRNMGVVVGKRLYRSMVYDEGVWVPDGRQVLTGYLVSYHLSRSPVICSADQMAKIMNQVDTL